MRTSSAAAAVDPCAAANKNRPSHEEEYTQKLLNACRQQEHLHLHYEINTI
jgi:hypothetical protein